MSSAPSGVSVLPPPCSPPIADATAALASEPFTSSTRTQARRYDMPNDFAAAVIERVSRIASSSAILPGPTKIASPAVTRRRKRATGRGAEVRGGRVGMVSARRRQGAARRDPLIPIVPATPDRLRGDGPSLDEEAARSDDRLRAGVHRRAVRCGVSRRSAAPPETLLSLRFAAEAPIRLDRRAIVALGEQRLTQRRSVGASPALRRRRSSSRSPTRA